MMAILWTSTFCISAVLLATLLINFAQAHTLFVDPMRRHDDPELVLRGPEEGIQQQRLQLQQQPTHLQHFSQIWFCLERCGYNRSDSLAQLETIQRHNKTITHISLEHYDLGPNSTLIDNNFSDIVADVKKAGFVPVAMVTTVSLSRMREVFMNPNPFIVALRQSLLAKGFKGVDFDFEPNDNGNDYDAAIYALFLSHVAFDLRQHGLTVSSDVATWNGVWDFSLLGLSVAQITTMNTYTTSYSNFVSQYEFAAQYVLPYRMIVGLLVPLNTTGVAQRFDFLQSHNVCKIAIWDSPIPDYWWTHLEALARRCA